MRYSQLHQLVLANFAISNKLVPNIIGEPGGGKSTLARHIIRDLGIRKDRIVEFNPSLHDPTDILGLPNNTGEYSRWVPPEEFYRIRDDGTDEPCALLLEEISDAIMAMQNPLCRLILDRHAGMMPLHPKLYIIATGNETKHKSGANRLATKLSNRMQHLRFDVSIHDFSQWWLEQDLDVVLLQFLRFREALLIDFDPSRDVNPTPRSWEMVARCDHKLPSDLYFGSVAGCVGEGPAAEYVAFRKVHDSLPSIDGILLHPDTADVPSKPEVLYALVGALARRSSKDNFDRVCKYAFRLPPEFQVMTVSDSTTRDKSLKNTKAFVEFAVRNKNLMI